MRRIAVAIVTLSLLLSCVSIDCPVSNTVHMVYSLQKADGTTDTMGVDTLTVWSPRADGTDTTLINRLCGTKAVSFAIPVSHTQPEDVVCLKTQDTIGTVWMDTVWVKKLNTPHFESVDCQAVYFHEIEAVRSTHRIVDTVIIQKTEVNNDATTPHILLRLKARR